MNSQLRRIIGLSVICFLVCSAIACHAGNLSRRRAAARGASSRSMKARPSRRALGAAVHKASPQGRYDVGSTRDGVASRAFRSVFRLDARGGGIHGAIGQHMARGTQQEAARRRTAQRWQNGVGYAINAGRAAKYLGYMARP